MSKKKEIHEIISENSPSNENFVAQLLRSLENNKHNDEATLSRKLGKHCKKENQLKILRNKKK